MPLHRTAKGDSPQEALTQLVKRIERGGGTVVQIIETEAEWLVQASITPAGYMSAGVELRAS